MPKTPHYLMCDGEYCGPHYIVAKGIHTNNMPKVYTINNVIYNHWMGMISCPLIMEISILD
jgi:hypothetical protein